MSEICYKVKSLIDGKIQPARCKFCKLLTIEYNKFGDIDYFGFCSFYRDRKPRIGFACEHLNPKEYVVILDRSLQLKLF